jgi:hypothetical protein
MWLKLAIFRGFGHKWDVIDYVVIFLIFINHRLLGRRPLPPWNRRRWGTHPAER